MRGGIRCSNHPVIDMSSILEVRHLKKRYKSTQAVDDICFSIAPGTCFGLLGPNGAGKTTTIEIIEGILAPDEGEIHYKGQPRNALFREEVGIQFQHTALLATLTVRETIQTFHRLYAAPADIDDLLITCHLTDIQNHMNDRISGGQRQRLLLALALINDPELLFLDEPSTGLDPQARRNLWDIVQKIKARGNTIVLTTHYMEEAQHLCDQVAVMDRGKIIAEGSPRELIQRYCNGVTLILPRENNHRRFKDLPLTFRENNDHIEIDTDDVNAALNHLMALRMDLTDLTVQSPNLENVFLNLTGRKLRE